MVDSEIISDVHVNMLTRRESKRGGRVLLTEIPLPRIARLASNCSTGSRLPNFNERISSKGSN